MNNVALVNREVLSLTCNGLAVICNAAVLDRHPGSLAGPCQSPGSEGRQ